MTKSGKQYRGCIATNLLDKKSWTSQPKTNKEKWELTRQEAETMRSQMSGLPIRLDHNKKFTVGKVLDAYITDDNKWEIDFEIYDDELAVRHVLENKYPVELSLSHYMNLQKPEEVSLCWVGCRQGCQVYEDKTGNIQNDAVNQDLHNNDILVQASISQVLTPLNSSNSSQNPYSIQASAGKPNSAMTSTQPQQVAPQHQQPSASALHPHQPQQQQQQQTQNQNQTEQAPAKDNTGTNTISQEDAAVSEENVDESMERFHEVMSKVLDLKTLSGNDKKHLGDGVLNQVRAIQELTEQLKNKQDSETNMREEIERLRTNELKNKEHMKAEVDKLCESWLSMPGVQWQQNDRDRLREMSAAGELDKLCQAIGPQLVQCSMTAASLIPTPEEQEHQQAHQEEQERILPWNQQLTRVMNQRKIGLQPFQGSNRMYNNDPVRCSVKRSHEQAFTQGSSHSSAGGAISSYKPSGAMSRLPAEILNKFADAVNNPMRYDPVSQNKNKRANI